MVSRRRGRGTLLCAANVRTHIVLMTGLLSSLLLLLRFVVRLHGLRPVWCRGIYGVTSAELCS